jgi:hypothetical protein
VQSNAGYPAGIERFHRDGAATDDRALRRHHRRTSLVAPFVFDLTKVDGTNT